MICMQSQGVGRLADLFHSICEQLVHHPLFNWLALGWLQFNYTLSL